MRTRRAITAADLEEVRCLARDGLTLRQISRHTGRTEEVVRHMAHTVKAQVPPPVKAPERAAPMTPAEARRLLEQQARVHASGVPHGVCRRCSTTHPLSRGRLKSHLYQGKPCDQLSRPPITG